MTTAKPLALVIPPRALGAAEAAAETCEIVVWPELPEPAAFLAARSAEVRAVVTISTLPFPVPLSTFPALQLLAFFGAGYATDETTACRARGIAIAHAPATNHLDVADLAVGLALATIRRIGTGDRLIRAGGWRGLNPVPIAPSLRDLQVGIVGLGAIGTAVAERLAAFGCRIAWWGPRAKPGARWRRADSLIDLARDSDVLIIAAAGDEGSRNLIDATILRALGRRGYLVNVARGFVVDEEALIAALRAGELAGAGLDVFAAEPTDAGRWSEFDQVVTTPHLGGWARGSIAAQQHLLATNLERHFAGMPLATPIPG